ncbi:MAG: DUF2461 domain-containing protein [Gammaproteobacteria bacterium]|nr:DUF2461 domain-containing protein [Gammaproteobacteria bacterium]
MDQFTGFSEGSLSFLEQLARNNDKAWFHANKDGYERLIREPALALIKEMGPRLEGLSPHFRAIAKKNGGSLMRVYRDIRFSKDKTPYKTNIGIQFRHALGKDVHAPGFYLHIEPGRCFLGAGIWHPDNSTLGKIRDFILDNPASWKTALDQPGFKRGFVLEGDSLKRAPKGYPADHELLEDLRRKDFIACKTFDCREITQHSLPQFVMRNLKSTDNFMRYLCTALEIPY